MQNGNHDVNANRDPNLGVNCIGCISKEVFDSQILLDPAKEEFDLPPQLVELGDVE